MLTGMRLTELPDEQWKCLEPLLPLGGYEEDLELITKTLNGTCTSDI